MKNLVIRHSDGSFIARGNGIERFTQKQAEVKLAWLKENDPRPGTYSIVPESEIPASYAVLTDEHHWG
jgi:hypothetical protein